MAPRAVVAARRCSTGLGEVFATWARMATSSSRSWAWRRSRRKAWKRSRASSAASMGGECHQSRNSRTDRPRFWASSRRPGWRSTKSMMTSASRAVRPSSATNRSRPRAVATSSWAWGLASSENMPNGVYLGYGIRQVCQYGFFQVSRQVEWRQSVTSIAVGAEQSEWLLGAAQAGGAAPSASLRRARTTASTSAGVTARPASSLMAAMTAAATTRLRSVDSCTQPDACLSPWGGMPGPGRRGEALDRQGCGPRRRSPVCFPMAACSSSEARPLPCRRAHAVGCLESQYC